MWKNSLYNTLGGLIRLGLGLISVPLLTRNLGIESYGLYAATNAIVSIALFSEWSVSSSITVFISKDIATSSTRKLDSLSVSVIYVIGLSLVTTILIYFSAPWIAGFFRNLNSNDRTILQEAIQIGAGVVCVRLLIQFFIGVLQAYKTYGIINILSTVHTIATILSTLYIASTSKNIVLIQTLQLIVALIMFAIYFVCCFQLGFIRSTCFTKPTVTYLTSLSKYGVRMWIASLGTTLFSQFDRLIILRLLGAEWAGVYSAITSVANQINVVSSMPIQPLLPVLSEYHQKSFNEKNTESLLIKAFIINASVIILAGTGIIVFSSELINILFRVTSLSLNLIQACLVIVTLAYSVYSFNAVGYFSLLAIRNEKFVTNLVLLSGAFSLLAIYVLSIHFGVIGACVGNLGYSLTLLLNLRIINKLNINHYTFIKSTIFPVAVALTFCCISLIFHNFYVNVSLYALLIIVVFYSVKSYFNLNQLRLRKLYKF